jgi:hypothetical protein
MIQYTIMGQIATAKAMIETSLKQKSKMGFSPSSSPGNRKQVMAAVLKITPITNQYKM